MPSDTPPVPSSHTPQPPAAPPPALPPAASPDPAPGGGSTPPGFWRWVYNHNPFYVISTLLMLYAVRAAYGVMAIGEIDSWSLLGVMGGYTLLLAAIGVLIVRWGRVWEDARSIVLLLLLLFLAVSVSADDLFTQERTAPIGIRILLAGYLFSAVVTETVLIGTRLHLPWVYRIPLHLFLALFFAAPYAASPEIQGWLANELNWVVFLFPIVGGALFLTLLPAVRSGPALVARNGTPWRWPLYPWSAFAMLSFAVAFRSYVFALTFSQTGKIWIEFPSSGLRMDRSVHAIALDTIWGPYFLVPLLLAILLLMFEASRITGNHRLTRRTLWWSGLLIPLSIVPTGGRVYAEFFQLVTTTIGSPLWLTTCLVSLFLGYAWLRGVASARVGAIGTLALLSVVCPSTTSFATLVAPEPWMLLVLLVGLSIWAWRRGSTVLGFVACGLAAYLLVGVLPESLSARTRLVIGFHVLWGGIVALGLTGRDEFAGFLRIVGAALFPSAAFAIVGAVRADLVPLVVRLAYAVLLTLIAFEIARRWRLMSYAWAGGGVALTLLYLLLARAYWQVVALYGAQSATAIVWSLGALLAGTLISTHKAGWLRWRVAAVPATQPDSRSSE